MTGTLLEFLAERYFPERDLKPSTKKFFLYKLQQLKSFLGRDPELGDLTSETINRFLDFRLPERAKETVRGERSAFRAIWQAAFDLRLVNDPPQRVKRIKRTIPV